MPDGYGDGMDLSILGLSEPRFGLKDNWDKRTSLSACARICKILGLGRRDTLKVLGLKQSNENYWWLQDVWGEVDG